MNIRTIAYAEFRVEDVPKAADQLVSGFGFRQAGDAVPGSGALLVHGGVRLVLRPAAEPGGGAADYVVRHGDGVSAVAVVCDDPRAALAEAGAHGARILSESDCVIEVFDDFALRFVDPADPLLAPRPAADGPEGAFEAIDHLALCVPAGAMAPTVEFCERVLGLRRIFGDFIEVGAQAMDSVVVQSESGEVTFTLLEPCTEREPGQIDAFLAAHGGPGVQHLALRTGDIASAVRRLGARGVPFLTTPAAYYDDLDRRLGQTGLPIEVLRELHVLVDQDHGGRLFQIFTRSVHPRGTYFFELIERRGARSFGTANITALYEAIERQQATSDH
jgi:4-hydroxymandelate synthase